MTEPGYVTDVITDEALHLMDRYAKGGYPFYRSVHYTAPHSPWDRDNHPKALYDDYRAHCAFDSLPREPMHRWQINSAPYGHDEERRRDILSGYFSAVTAMDANLGRLLDWLNAAPHFVGVALAVAKQVERGVSQLVERALGIGLVVACLVAAFAAVAGPGAEASAAGSGAGPGAGRCDLVIPSPRSRAARRRRG